MEHVQYIQTICTPKFLLLHLSSPLSVQLQGQGTDLSRLSAAHAVAEAVATKALA
jgi:hypothetical protein